MTAKHSIFRYPQHLDLTMLAQRTLKETAIKLLGEFSRFEQTERAASKRID